MSTHEVALGFEYLYSTLSGDSTLINELAPGGVHRAMAPPSTTAPYIVFIFQSGNDDEAFRAVRAASELLYQVKVVGPAKDTASLVSAASRLDTVITTPDEVSVAGGTIKACYRFQPLHLDELVNGELWTNLGGLYRIVAKSA